MKNSLSDCLNPEAPVEISPEQYERQVAAWLRNADGSLENMTVTHQAVARGSGGEFRLDGLAEFEIFGGAKIKVLVECKKHRRPVERQVVLGVFAQMSEVGAQKAMIFSTSGFQRGAIEYASDKGIALVSFCDGKVTYFTRSKEPVANQYYPPDLPTYAGFMVQKTATGLELSIISDGEASGLSLWIAKR